MTKFEEEVKRPENGPLVELNNNMQEVFSQYRKMRQYADYLEYELNQKDEQLQEKATKLTFAEEEIHELGDKIGQLESQLQQQALAVVPEDVAKLPPFDDMKEYVLDERLLTIREFLNKLDDKSNNEITEAEAWCMIHEDIAYRAMLYGYTVEEPLLFEVKMPIVYWDDEASQLTNGFDFLRIDKETDEVDFVGFLSNTKKHTVHFTEQKIKSIDERYWQFAVPVEDGE